MDKLKNLGMIFYFAFIRCYLYYFVKLQLEFIELGDLSRLNQNLLDISNSGFVIFCSSCFVVTSSGSMPISVAVSIP